jgi:hypothetical protein
MNTTTIRARLEKDLLTTTSLEIGWTTRELCWWRA